MTMVQRTYRADLEATKGKRIIVGRAVPYGVATRVSDDGRTAYLEEWRHGVFAAAAKPANLGRMRRYMSDTQVSAWEEQVQRRRQGVPPTLNYTHDESDPLNWIGRTQSLEERPDGLYGEWVVDETDRGDWALEKVRTGQLVGLSVGADLLPGGTVLRDDVRVRVSARLIHVALVREAAFEEAMVLATRAERLPAQHDVSEWSARVEQLRSAVH